MVSTLDQEDETVDAAFLDTMSSGRENAWFAEIAIEGKAATFKLDTGAEVTAVSQETWRMLEEPLLQPSNRHLFGAARQALEVKGCFRAHLSHKGKETHQQVYVVRNLRTNLLGLPAISALHLATRVDTLKAPPLGAENVKNKFPKSSKA
jgi:hypothetical protein